MRLPIVIFTCFLDVVYALQCTSNCSMILSMSEQYQSPTNCSLITANYCSVKLVFWYEHRNYTVSFFGDDFLEQHNMGESRQFIMIETGRKKFFSYDIYHHCRETDDCAVEFAKDKIIQMTNRIYNVSKLYYDLGHVLRRRLTLSQNLACFDMNDAVRQCTVPGMSGSCQIIDDLIKHRFHRRLCLHTIHESASVNIYDSESFAMMTIKCTHMLCNGPITVAAVKKILNKNNLTDIHGRLPGTSVQTQINRYLFLITICLTFWM